MLALHQHNEQQAAQTVLAALQRDQRVAYVPDAGTPGFSDPGAKLVEQVRAAGLKIVPIPGCNATATAISVCGSWAHTFNFVGFLPTSAGPRLQALQNSSRIPHAVVFYEAPHRVLKLLDELLDHFGPNRQILIGRELTKMHETLVAGTLAQARTQLQQQAEQHKGEFVIVVEGQKVNTDSLTVGTEQCLHLLLSELPTSKAVKIASALTGQPRSSLYQAALLLKKS